MELQRFLSWASLHPLQEASGLTSEGARIAFRRHEDCKAWLVGWLVVGPGRGGPANFLRGLLGARLLTVCTVFLVLLGIAASLDHLFASEHYNAGFVEYPMTTGLHVTLGAVYLGLALSQFSSRIRSQWPAAHRVCGRLAVIAGVGAGFTALVISALFPFSGPAEWIVVGPFALLFTYSLVRGIGLARTRRFTEHREWMTRAMAVGTSISTMRLIFVPTLIALGQGEELARWLSLASFGIAFVIHSTAAELWIRSTRPSRPREPVGFPQRA